MKAKTPFMGAVVIVSGKFDEKLIGAPTFHFAAVVTEVLPDGKIAVLAMPGPTFLRDARQTAQDPRTGQIVTTALPPIMPTVLGGHNPLPLAGTWRYPHEHMVGVASIDGRAAVAMSAPPSHNGHDNGKAGADAWQPGPPPPPEPDPFELPADDAESAEPSEADKGTDISDWLPPPAKAKPAPPKLVLLDDKE